jgi:hypothetical protein
LACLAASAIIAELHLAMEARGCSFPAACQHCDDLLELQLQQCDGPTFRPEGLVLHSDGKSVRACQEPREACEEKEEEGTLVPHGMAGELEPEPEPEISAQPVALPQLQTLVAQQQAEVQQLRQQQIPSLVAGPQLATPRSHAARATATLENNPVTVALENTTVGPQSSKRTAEAVALSTGYASVAELLGRVGLLHLLPVCVTNQMDSAALALCEAADLEEIGLAPADAATIIVALQASHADDDAVLPAQRLAEVTRNIEMMENRLAAAGITPDVRAEDTDEKSLQLHGQDSVCVDTEQENRTGPTVPPTHARISRVKCAVESRCLAAPGYQIRMLQAKSGMVPGTVATIVRSNRNGQKMWHLDNGRTVAKKGLGTTWELEAQPPGPTQMPQTRRAKPRAELGMVRASTGFFHTDGTTELPISCYQASAPWSEPTSSAAMRQRVRQGAVLAGTFGQAGPVPHSGEHRTTISSAQQLAKHLLLLPTGQRKQFLGERLYPLIKRHCGNSSRSWCWGTPRPALQSSAQLEGKIHRVNPKFAS